MELYRKAWAVTTLLEHVLWLDDASAPCSTHPTPLLSPGQVLDNADEGGIQHAPADSHEAPPSRIPSSFWKQNEQTVAHVVRVLDPTLLDSQERAGSSDASREESGVRQRWVFH